MGVLVVMEMTVNIHGTNVKTLKGNVMTEDAVGGGGGVVVV